MATNNSVMRAATVSAIPRGQEMNCVERNKLHF